MDKIRVLVASQNRIKALSAKDALEIFAAGQVIKVTKPEFEVTSLVADQPMSLQESAAGALNRLNQVRKIDGYTYYIAIEGGAFPVDTPAGTIWYEAACAAVVGTNQAAVPSVAFGPAYPIPKRIARHLHEGKDLNEAMELETGITEIGKAGGFNGWLTDGNLNRRVGSAQAVLLALYGLKYAEK
jgi:inosine/xanthosine triphosphatase